MFSEPLLFKTVHKGNGTGTMVVVKVNRYVWRPLQTWKREKAFTKAIQNVKVINRESQKTQSLEQKNPPIL